MCKCCKLLRMACTNPVGEPLKPQFSPAQITELLRTYAMGSVVRHACLNMLAIRNTTHYIVYSKRIGWAAQFECLVVAHHDQLNKHAVSGGALPLVQVA